MYHQILRKAENPQQDIRRYGKNFMQIINDTMKPEGIDAGNKHLIPA